MAGMNIPTYIDTLKAYHEAVDLVRAMALNVEAAAPLLAARANPFQDESGHPTLNPAVSGEFPFAAPGHRRGCPRMRAEQMHDPCGVHFSAIGGEMVDRPPTRQHHSFFNDKCRAQ